MQFLNRQLDPLLRLFDLSDFDLIGLLCRRHLVRRRRRPVVMVLTLVLFGLVIGKADALLTILFPLALIDVALNFFEHNICLLFQ